MKYEQQIFNPMAWSQEDLVNKKKLEDEIVMFDRLASQRFAFEQLNESYHYFRQRSRQAQEQLQALITSNNDLHIPMVNYHG